MPEGSELEIKLSADPHLFEQIMNDPEVMSMLESAASATYSMETLYYDTSDFALQQAGFAYRVRRCGEEWIATLKSDLSGGGGFFAREEWNEKQEGPEPSLQKFSDTHAGNSLIALVGASKLQLLFSTRFDRNVLNLRTSGGTRIELALDKGMIWSGSTGSPIGEIELELKEGDVGDLLDLAGWMSLHWHLKPELRSKYARGIEILNNNQPVKIAAAPATVVKYPFPVSLIDPCVTDVFLMQAEVLKNRAAPTTIRMMRIQIRRLRALLKFYQPLLPAEECQLHTERFRQWGTLLGSIRDIDLMEKAWNSFCQLYYPGTSYSSDEWIHSIRERREFLAENVLYRLNQGELNQSVFALQAWVYRGIKTTLTGAEGKKADAFVRKLLMQTVEDLREEIREICGIVDIKTQHRFRLRVKNLRYIMEALFQIPRYRDDIFLATLQKLQTTLGKIHDAAQIKSLLNQFEAGSGENERDSVIKELFISWRSRDLWNNLNALPKEIDIFRKAAKDYLRTLTALRTLKKAKPGHDACPQEPQ